MLQVRWLLLLVLPIAACASFDDSFQVTPFLREQVTGDTWRACLAREYQVQTRLVLRESRDWAEASQFSSRGWAALRGEDVPPGLSMTVPRDGELGQAWVELAASLARPGERRCECAKAQAAFDGWLAASARLGGNVEATRTNFKSALDACHKATGAR
jgi:hypothetical protein